MKNSKNDSTEQIVKGLKKINLLDAIYTLKKLGVEIPKNVDKMKKSDLYRILRTNMKSTNLICIKKLNKTNLEQYHLTKYVLPHYHNGWLSNLDIDGIIYSKTKHIPDFLYLGSLPIDYENIPSYSYMKNLSYPTLVNIGKKRMACIINTAKAKTGGEHWTAIFIDARENKKTICYFNSYNVSFQRYPEISRFISTAKTSLSLSEKENAIAMQKRGGECGMYCIYFILNRLSDKECGFIIGTDEQMKRYRKKIMI